MSRNAAGTLPGHWDTVDTFPKACRARSRSDARVEDRPPSGPNGRGSRVCSGDADSTAGVLVVRPAYPMIGSRFDALHASLVEVNDHLSGANADAEAFEDLVGEFLNFGNGGAQSSLDSRGIVFIERHRWRR